MQPEHSGKIVCPTLGTFSCSDRCFGTLLALFDLGSLETTIEIKRHSSNVGIQTATEIVKCLPDFNA